MSKKMEELYHRLQYFEKIGVMRLQRGEQMEFPCPQCGGTAHAVKFLIVCGKVLNRSSHILRLHTLNMCSCHLRSQIGVF